AAQAAARGDGDQLSLNSDDGITDDDELSTTSTSLSVAPFAGRADSEEVYLSNLHHSQAFALRLKNHDSYNHRLESEEVLLNSDPALPIDRAPNEPISNTSVLMKMAFIHAAIVERNKILVEQNVNVLNNIPNMLDTFLIGGSVTNDDGKEIANIVGSPKVRANGENKLEISNSEFYSDQDVTTSTTQDKPIVDLPAQDALVDSYFATYGSKNVPSSRTLLDNLEASSNPDKLVRMTLKDKDGGNKLKICMQLNTVASVTFNSLDALNNLELVRDEVNSMQTEPKEIFMSKLHEAITYRCNKLGLSDQEIQQYHDAAKNVILNRNISLSPADGISSQSTPPHGPPHGGGPARGGG
ncbi:MAG: hypothetical protein AAF153_02745, partial [Pseudomonadota bacterium]